MGEMVTKKPPKTPKEFECKFCDFKCSNKKDYNRHLLTRKHKMITNDKNLSFTQNNEKPFVCDCGASYKYVSGLSRHKKKCTYYIENECKEEELKDNNYKNLMNTIIEENSELRNLLIKQQKQISELIPKVGNNNTTNNNFNLNVFLNEHCKDALNMYDFINSLQAEFSQMEYTASHGFVEGITTIFTKAIENMDITMRPIHCTDLKREILYIKDNEEWNKDNDEKEQMKMAINKLKHNNLNKVSEWVQDNPGCEKYDNPKNDLFINMIKEHTIDDEKIMKKVIKSIAKNVIIPKSYNNDKSEIDE